MDFYGGKGSYIGIFKFIWNEYSHCNWFQSISMMPQNAELEIDAHNIISRKEAILYCNIIIFYTVILQSGHLFFKLFCSSSKTWDSQKWISKDLCQYFKALDCCSFPKSCLTLCNPMDFSTPVLPVLHYLPEFAQLMGLLLEFSQTHNNIY